MILKYKTLLVCVFLLISFYQGFSQNEVYGKLVDQVSLRPIDLATCYLKKNKIYVESTEEGFFLLKTDLSQGDTLLIDRVGYKSIEVVIPILSDQERYQVNVEMVNITSNLEVIVIDSRTKMTGQIVEVVEELSSIPTTTGNIESALPFLALGVQTGGGGELSSQYNVRGGNFDENIVLINDFEIYRPQLVSNSQQEGLSVANQDLIETLSFSSGGFSAKYGDKMSSVLDIKYKIPDSVKASVSASLLGATAHLEGVSKTQKFRYLLGTRYKTTTYLLNSSQIQGEYLPKFLDLQTYLTYDLSTKWQLAWMSNFNRSIFDFVPTTVETTIGGIQSAQRFRAEYAGAEYDQFQSFFNGISLTYNRTRNSWKSYIKAMGTVYSIYEEESYDILANYLLTEISTSLGAGGGEDIALLGSGIYHTYNKRFLDSDVYRFQLRGGHERITKSTENELETHYIQWGGGLKQENLVDIYRLWERIDSADYNLPNSELGIELAKLEKGQNDLKSYKSNVYGTYTFSSIKNNAHELKAELGVRLHHWTFNNELFVNPRGQILYKPLNWKKDLSFKLAVGLYHQPGFYRDVLIQGKFNTDFESQKSFHLVGGTTWDFTSKGGTPYRFIAEAYYKNMWNVVPYNVDNVRITYFDRYNANAYAYGLDLRLNGELIPNAESWINLSLLSTKEKIDGIDHKKITENRIEEVEYVPRATSRLINVSLLIQDYFKDKEHIKMQMRIIAGSGLPFGKPEDFVFRNPYKFKAYFRTDIGFSYVIFDKKDNARSSLFDFTDRTWISFEVFNLLNIRNHANNIWIKDVFNNYHAIQNKLTGRRLNVRFRMDF